MRRIALICAVALLLLVFVSCKGWGPQDPVTTPPEQVSEEPTSSETTPEVTTPEVTTPEETTPEETTPEATTPAVTEPDFENDPDPDGTKRY